MSPPRLAVAWCPHWPVVAADAGAEEAVAVLHASRVVARSRVAGDGGVQVGMRRREAQSRCPGVRLEARHPEREARAFERVVHAVAALVPRLECTEPGTLAFLARGPARYFGGDSAMAALVGQHASSAVGDALGAVGGVVGVGVADGRFAATVAARLAAGASGGLFSRPSSPGVASPGVPSPGVSSFGNPVRGEPVVVPAGSEATAAFLAPLPVRVLTDAAGVDAGFVGLLQRLGLSRLGMLAELPAADVADRFGPLGAFAHRLATGGDDRLPGATDPPQGREVRRVFEEPVHHSDALVFVARQMAAELVGGLEGLVCTRLAVIAETEHGERSERVWFRADGLGASAVVERVRWQVDAWARDDVLTAGVVLLRLDPVEVRPDDGTQVTLWGGRTDADDRAARAVARLTALAGEQQVLVPEAVGGRQPSDRYGWVPAALTDLADRADRGDRADGAGLTGRDGPAQVQAPWPGSLPPPSPAVVHPVPLPVEVLDRAGRPVAVNGRGVVSAPPARLRMSPDSRPQHGVEQPIVAWAGPWPIDERWWDLRRARRIARFQVLTETGMLLLLGLERGRWSVWAEYA